MNKSTVAETKVTHTPGPWSVQGPVGASHGPEWEVSTEDGHGVWTARCQRAADAHLIAAAPDLLDSLREFVTLYDGVRDSLGPIVREKLARAEAAIAKAEGGAQ